jgi:hypothetical protein
MGSENLFEKRKARTQLKKSLKPKFLQKRFLIICEGSKTEVRYFEDLRNALNLSQENVQIKHEDTSPKKIVKFALDACSTENKSRQGFDEVFCVFDRDHHPSFNEAVCQINAHKKLRAITSTPCFEFWLLLHFGYTDKPFGCTPHKSIGDHAKDELKLKPGFNNYEKSDSVYKKLADKTEHAIRNAQKLENSFHGENPSTQVHHLVLELQELAKSNL